MAKRKSGSKAKPQPKALTRKQVSRLQREKRVERSLLIGVVAVALAVVGVIAYGFIAETVVKAREAVAIVGDTPVRTVDFQAQARFLRMQMRLELTDWQNQRMSLDPTDEDSQFYLDYIDDRMRQLEDSLSEANALVIGEQALDQLILYEIVRQEAERRGISVSEDDVQRNIELSLNYDRTASTLPLTSTDEVTSTVALPTPITQDDFQRQYDTIVNDLLKPLDISERQYRSWVRGDVLVQRLQEQMAEDVAEEADQVKLHLISTPEEDEANALAARLDAGEAFQTLVEELEADEETSASTSELEWFTRDQIEAGLGEDLSDQAFSLSVGEYSAPVESAGGSFYTIIEVLGRETRPLDENVRQQLAESAFQEWVDAQQVLVVRKTYSDRVPTEP
jgi:parvulin-like peptidyl-prolyl isomerase